MATNWVDEVLSGATSTASKTLSLATGNALSVANSSSESIFTVTSDTSNGGYTSILGIEGQEAVLFLGADNADDAGDAWEVHSDTSGNFKIGNRTSGTGSPTRSNTFTNALSIDSSRDATLAGDLTITGADIIIGADSDGTDRTIVFGHSTLKSIIGIDDSQDAFVINTDAAFENTNDFEIDASGNVTIGNGTIAVAGTSTLTGLVTASAGVKLGNNIIYASDGGSTITLDTSDNVTILGDLTVTGGTLTFGSGAIAANESGGTGGTNILQFSGENIYQFVGTEGNDCKINLFADEGDDDADKVQLKHNTSGVTSFQNKSTGSYVTTIKWDASGNLEASGSLILADTKKLHLDGSTSGDTYIMQNGGDVLDIVVGGATMIKLTESGTDTMTVTGDLTVGVDDTGHDVKFFGATASAFMLWDQSEDDLVLSGTAQLSIDTTTDASSTTTGSFHTDGGVGIAKKLYVGTDLDVDGTANLDAVDIDGNVQLDGTFTLGSSGSSTNDFKLWGANADNYMLWDTSADQLEIHTNDNSTALLISSTATRSANDAPDLVIYKNSVPNDDDYLGSIKFRSLDAGDSTVQTYSEIDTFVRDADDGTADGAMILSVMSHGTLKQGLKIRSSNNGATAVTQTQVTNGALVLDDVTFTADDATPRVDGGNIFTTGDNTGSTTITQLDNGATGQIVILTCNASGTAPTIADGGNFVLSAAWEPGAHDTLTLFTKNGTTWREISRSDN